MAKENKNLFGFACGIIEINQMGVINVARAKYQVLVLPYCRTKEKVEYCIFKRSDMKEWQFIAGGGEEEDISVLESAKREALEEANISLDDKYTKLDATCSISTEHFPKARKTWGVECLIIPEYSFAVEITKQSIVLSSEHLEYQWVEYDQAIKLLKFDSNKVTLWELDNKIKMNLI